MVRINIGKWIFYRVGNTFTIREDTWRPDEYTFSVHKNVSDDSK